MFFGAMGFAFLLSGVVFSGEVTSKNWVRLSGQESRGGVWRALGSKVKSQSGKFRIELSNGSFHEYKIFPGLDFESDCLQVLEVLSEIRRESLVVNYGSGTGISGKVRITCENGAYVTGMVSALYRIAFQGLPMSKSFEEEMCKRGFEIPDVETNAEKTQFMQREFTRFYLQMALMFHYNDLHPGQLDEPLSWAVACRAGLGRAEEAIEKTIGFHCYKANPKPATPLQ